MGYMSLDMWVLANILQLGTQDFCERFLNLKNDPCGRQYDQMTQAARSGVANIVEGYSRHQTSRETEMKLMDVSRASLAELMGDYYNFLLHRGALPWSKGGEDSNCVSHIALDHASYTGDWMRESAAHVLMQKAKFNRYLNGTDELTMANTLLLLCVRAINMLENYISNLLDEFKETGGFTENMTAERLETIKQRNAESGDAPKCPICGAPMVKKMAKKGVNAGKEFWSCSNYTTTGCKGTRKISISV